MDRNERINSTVNALQKAQDGLQQKIWTTLPGIVESFDSAKITAVVQPAIQAQLRDPVSGVWSNVTLPLCLDCPVKFLWGSIGGFTIPVKKSDTGLLVFSSRCIDAWWQSGGVQPQAEFRMHDLSDGFFLPGVLSQNNLIANFNNDFPEMRNADGSIKLTMAADGFNVTGNLNVTGEITHGVGAAKVTLTQHEHAANNTPPTPGH